MRELNHSHIIHHMNITEQLVKYHQAAPSAMEFIAQVRAATGASQASVYRWISEGCLPPGKTLIRLIEFLQYLKQKGEQQ